jgi:glycyl-tRNA synthetase
MAAEANTMEKIVALCKRRGFIFQSSEIYGGIGGFWDYGPLGTELKRNIKDAWWQDMVRNPPPGPGGQDIQMVGVDCSIIMNPKVWEASGHVGGFSDPMVDVKGVQRRFRADQLQVDLVLQVDGARSGYESGTKASESRKTPPPNAIPHEDSPGQFWVRHSFRLVADGREVRT